MAESAVFWSKKRVALAALGAAALLAGGVALGTFVGGKAPQQSRSLVSYRTQKALQVLLPGSRQELSLYRNEATALEAYSLFQQSLASGAYVGPENFAQLRDETVFLQSNFLDYDSSSGQLEADYVLYSVKNGRQTLIDSGVSGISCASAQSVYYLKYENDMPVQYRYRDGVVTPVTDLIPDDFALVTHCSQDDKVLGFAAATLDGAGNYAMNNGYLVDGQERRFGSGSLQVLYLSPDGEQLYAGLIQDELGRATDLYTLAPRQEQEPLLLAQNVTEVSFYEEDGSASFIAVEELSEELQNPVGMLLHFDPQSGESLPLAGEAVALLEATPRSYAWLNEQADELLITEQGSRTSFPKQLAAGQAHYINAQGALCASDGQQTVELFPDFYQPESYAYGEGLYYLACQGQDLIWAQGDVVYRYRAGSLAEPQRLQLEAPLEEKIQSGTEIGYVLLEDGSVLEQSGSTLTARPFEGSSYTVLDSPEDVLFLGLSPDGKSFYYLDGAKALRRKALSPEGDSALVAENVSKALVCDDGLYYLEDGPEGRLWYQNFRGKTSLLREGVLSLELVMIQ